MDRDQLETRFLIPYREGRPVVIGGKTIPPEDIERIRINYTDETSEELLPIVRREEEERRRSSGAVLIGGPSDEWYVADRGKDVTDEIITGPPGSGVNARPERPGPSVQGDRVVFVVHGRNLKARDAMFTFLRSIGVYPLEWSEAVLATGKTNPYTSEIVDTAFKIAQAVIVLMTPDDEGNLRAIFREKGDPTHEVQLTPQARLNVIFEAGMAMGRFPDRTLLVELGVLRPFSDIAGTNVVRLNNTSQRRQELAQRLQLAGCPVNLSGTQWHNAGDFKKSIENPLITERSTK